MQVSNRNVSTQVFNQTTRPVNTYTVQSGDTLSGIATRHNVSLSALLSSNPQIQNPDVIYPDDIIKLPNPNTSGDAGSPAASNPTDTYIVERGDTLGQVASNHNVTLSRLIATNSQIKNPDLIFIGQAVNIPSQNDAPVTERDVPNQVDPVSTEPQDSEPTSSEFDYNLISGVEGNRHVTAEFVTQVESLADRLDTQPEYLLAVMSFESAGTFRPDITNSIGATGLIQFLPGTAKGLGTTTAALRQMDSVEQLEFVEKYFQQPHFDGKLGTVEGLYSAVLSGQATPNPDDTLTNFVRGRAAYSSNAPLDFNNDGRITSGEASSAVVSRLYGGVSQVQQQLLAAGVVPASQQHNFADGRFGPDTQTAITRFQTQNNLAATGYLDDATGRLLFNLDNNGAPSQPVDTDPAETGPALTGTDLQFSEAIYERSTPGRQFISSPVIGAFTITEGFMARGGPHSDKSARRAVFADNPSQVEHVPAGVYNLGIDYVTHDGRIDSWFDGEVVDIISSSTGYGNRLIMRSDLQFQYNGQQYPVYAHYAHAVGFTVQEGERISAGQDIGDQGSTGHSTGDHVDFHTWIDVGGERITISPNLLAQGSQFA